VFADDHQFGLIVIITFILTNTQKPIPKSDVLFANSELHQAYDHINALMHRKHTLVSTENDKNKEELHIITALNNCGYPNWISEKVERDQLNKELKTSKTKRPRPTKDTVDW